MVNQSLHGEGDSGKLNAAWAMVKRQKRDRKQDLPKVSNTHIGRRVLRGDKNGVETGSRTKLAAAQGLGAAAWSPGGSAGTDNNGGTPQKKPATSVGNAHCRVPRRGNNGAVPGSRRAAARGLGADAWSPGGAARG
jgi:hypothetical protein